MPNLAQALKEEITRLAKKVAKSENAKLKADVVRLKKSNVVLRKEVTQLKRDNELLMASEKRRQQSRPLVSPEKAGSARITSKGVRAMRKKLGLSRTEFGKLAGVSSMTVYNWERKDGPLRLKDKTRAFVVGLRGVGTREAKRRLEMAG